MPEGYLDAQPSPKNSTLDGIAPAMFHLMMRNVAGAGIVYSDPVAPERLSQPGCVLASPSFPQDPGSGKQNYVNNWTRDAAITMMEITAQGAPVTGNEVRQRMIDYVAFADTCQLGAPPHEFSIACFRIDGEPRCDPGFVNCWSPQSDGPALQTLAIHAYYNNLAGQVKTTAREVIERNLQFLLNASDDNVPPGVPGYQSTTFSPWEEVRGYSFFARAAQLRCLLAIQANGFDITVPGGVDDAINWLRGKLDAHWDPDNGYYCTFERGTTPDPRPVDTQRDPYDPNSDILMAGVYGAVPVTEPKFLSTAAKIRAVYEKTDTGYPINQKDHALGYGPLIGRYPGDYYDGDVHDSPENKDHPWALCSCNLAEVYYRLAGAVEQDNTSLPTGPLVEQFYEQIGLPAAPDAQSAVSALREAADSILNAVVFHSDNLELSEQYDETSGFEKSVSNLTWSYAAFLSAVRARSG
jgi:glucoamylase